MREQTHLLNDIKALMPQKSLLDRIIRTSSHTDSDKLCKARLCESIKVFVEQDGQVKRPNYFYMSLQMIYEDEVTGYSTIQKSCLDYILYLEEEIFQGLIELVSRKLQVIEQLKKMGLYINNESVDLDNNLLMLIDMYQQSIYQYSYLHSEYGVKARHLKTLRHLPDRFLNRLKTTSYDKLKVMAQVLENQCSANTRA